GGHGTEGRAGGEPPGGHGVTADAAFLLRSPACPSCCSRRTSCSAPRTQAGCLWALSEAPSTSCSCWSRGAASTCTRCAPPQHHCTVPTYSCAVTALAIHPATNNLVIAYADQQLFEFSIPQKQYTAWSRTVQNCGLHKAWLERDSPITHIAFNPQNPAHILLHDVYMFCVLDKSLPLPDASTPLLNQSTLKQLPEHARQRQLHAFKICKKFQPLLFAELLEENRLVLVERPLADIRAQLPPPVQQQPFGT
uniref:Uncharacterized protein n=1 Tax=Anas zonorhyncha TaxID=75864 RepID=A0A8B9U7L6_9AVES